MSSSCCNPTSAFGCTRQRSGSLFKSMGVFLAPLHLCDLMGTTFVKIPIVVVVIMLCLVALMMWSRHSLHHAVTTLGGIYNPSQAPARSGRELTAEQLAGSINGSELPSSGATARQTRRPRRPRRTPSQVSVTSLPAYNKEPGEEELVIFR